MLAVTTLQERARKASIARQLAVHLLSPEGETSRHYFQSRTAYENFVGRALAQGYRIEAITR